MCIPFQRSLANSNLLSCFIQWQLEVFFQDFSCQHHWQLLLDGTI